MILQNPFSCREFLRSKGENSPISSKCLQLSNAPFYPQPLWALLSKPLDLLLFASVSCNCNCILSF